MKLIWICWIGLILLGVLLPLGFIIALAVTSALKTIGGILVSLGMGYMMFECGQSAYRQRPWKQ